MVKRSAKGTVIQLSIATVFTTVAGVSKIDGPDDEVQFMDVTSLDSGVSLEDGEPSGHVAPGSVTGEGFYDPADTVHKALNAAMATPAKNDWKITNANISSFAQTFNGVLKSLKVSHAVKNAVKFNFEIKLTGIPTRAP